MGHSGVEIRRVTGGKQAEGMAHQRQVGILQPHQPSGHMGQALAKRPALFRIQAQEIVGLRQVQLHGVELAGLLVAAVAPGVAFPGEHRHRLPAGAGQRLDVVVPLQAHHAASLDDAVDLQYALVIVHGRGGLRGEMAEIGQVHQPADAVHVPRDDLAALFPGEAVDQFKRAPGRHMPPLPVKPISENYKIVSYLILNAILIL